MTAIATPPALADELAAASARLEAAEPREVIRWAAERFGDKLTMATAFGPEGCLILHWIAEVAPTTFVFNLETGYQFSETLELRDRIAAKYGLTVAYEHPETNVAEYERQHGGPLYRTDPGRCCKDRKLAVIRRVLGRFEAWMSGIRRDQSPDRAVSPIVGWDAILRYDVPYNPLHDSGYVSIGCAPCTRAVLDGEDERAGRWSGSAKTECGLHSRED